MMLGGCNQGVQRRMILVVIFFVFLKTFFFSFFVAICSFTGITRISDKNSGAIYNS